MKSTLYILFFSLFLSLNLQAQKDSLNIKTKKTQLKVDNYNPLSPAKAAFLSAVIPGAGQIYNNRYWWQLPLIYGGLGFSIYSFTNNNDKYNRYRAAFRLRQAGLADEFPQLSDTGLERAQVQFSKNRNLSLLSAILVYVLQITEASVRAHLLQFSTSKDLTISPTAMPDYNLAEAPKVGLTLKYSF